MSTISLVDQLLARFATKGLDAPEDLKMDFSFLNIILSPPQH
jgi:hypothetical protein